MCGYGLGCVIVTTNLHHSSRLAKAFNMHGNSIKYRKQAVCKQKASESNKHSSNRQAGSNSRQAAAGRQHKLKPLGSASYTQ